MTHQTEAERAEFEAWWSSPHVWSLGHKEAQWSAWQAARRAPAAPVQQEQTPLTIDEIGTCWQQMGNGFDKYEKFARAIERAHGIGATHGQ